MTRKWLPSEWMDEMPPTLGDSPDAFLKRNANGVLQLAPIDGDDEWPIPTDIEKGFVVDVWTWSDGTLFEVHVLESGVATFVEVQRPAEAGHPYGNEHEGLVS
jgi:hypothetical protein